MKNAFLLIAMALAIASCKNTATDKATAAEIVVDVTSNHPSYVTDMETAHAKARLLENEVICFNLDMTFGKNNSLMKIFTTPTSSAIRVDKKDGTSTIMIDGEVYTNADSTKWNREKFGIYTYQYFFMAPYKFSDGGTVWQKLPPMLVDSVMTDRSMLTFEAGTGDAPDDWYMVHSDPSTHLVQHIGYIVTGGGTSVEEAEKNAHAISYADYKEFAGIPFATSWTFSDYNKETGLGQQIGNGKIRNVEMMDKLDQFDVAFSDDYRKIVSK